MKRFLIRGMHPTTKAPQAKQPKPQSRGSCPKDWEDRANETKRITKKTPTLQSRGSDEQRDDLTRTQAMCRRFGAKLGAHNREAINIAVPEPDEPWMLVAVSGGAILRSGENRSGAAVVPKTLRLTSAAQPRNWRR